MKRLVELAVVVCLACAHGAQAAQSPESASALFSSGSDAFARGDYSAAETAFKAARAAGLSGPAVLYDIGVAQYKLGRYADSAETFRALAAQYPAMRELGEYNLGLALLRQGHGDDAREAFARVSGSKDPKLAELAEAMLAKISPPQASAGQEKLAAGSAGGEKRAGTDAVRLLDFGIGFDGNAALIDESSLPLGETAASPLLQVFGLLRGRPVAAWRLRFDGSAYAVRYSRAGEFNQTALRLGAAYDWGAHGWALTAEPYYSYGALAGQSFERRVGASIAATRRLGRASLQLGLDHETVADLDPRFDYVAGTRDRLSLDIQRDYHRGRLSVGYARELNDRDDARVSPVRNELYAGYEYFFWPQWSLETQGFRRTSRYTGLTQPRDEVLTELSVTARRNLTSGWLLEGEYRIGQNDSKDPVLSYERNSFAIGLSKLF
ncbi:MAG TPA: tetratricopeptide repeat protein [Gammaproteobacteria bacterium]|nr:tetratricopeptide repeat protein [Gammaproteobacteria bacterium]